MLLYIRLILQLLIILMLLNLIFNAESFDMYDSNNYVETKYPLNLKRILGISTYREDQAAKNKLDKEKAELEKKRKAEEAKAAADAAEKGQKKKDTANSDSKRVSKLETEEQVNRKKLSWFNDIQFNEYDEPYAKCPNDDNYISLDSICDSVFMTSMGTATEARPPKCSGNEEKDKYFCDNICNLGPNHNLSKTDRLKEDICKWNDWFTEINSKKEYKCPNISGKPPRFVTPDKICRTDTNDIYMENSCGEMLTDISLFCNTAVCQGCTMGNHILHSDDRFVNSYESSTF